MFQILKNLELKPNFENFEGIENIDIYQNSVVN